jgi:hypothetical protein
MRMERYSRQIRNCVSDEDISGCKAIPTAKRPPAARIHRSWPFMVLAMAWILSSLGCTSSSGSGNGGPSLSPMSWYGASAKELQQGLGPPDFVEQLPSNEKVMIYRWSRTQTTGGYAVPIGGYSQMGFQYVPTRTTTMNCLARYTIGANDRVRDIGLQGNDCWADPR